MKSQDLKNDMQARKTSFKQKLFLVLGSIVLTFLFLETGLRLGGFIYLSLQERRNQAALEKKDAYRIVCLGESTTANGGENAYPHQLEKILNRLNLGIPFSVINKGMPGRTSWEIAVHLEEILDQYKPQMVITMLGVNDRGDVLPYQTYRSDKLWVLLMSLRIYKLACLLQEHIKAKFFQGPRAEFKMSGVLSVQEVKESFNNKNPQEIADMFIALGIRYVYYNEIPRAINMFEKAVSFESSRKAAAYAYWGWCYRMDKQLEKAKEVLNKAIELDPKNSFAYQELGQCYIMEDQRELYDKMLKKAIEADAQDVLAYQRLALNYMLEGKNQLAYPYLEQAFALRPDDDRFLGRLGSFYMSRGDIEKAEEFFQKADQVRMDNYYPATKESYQKIKRSVLGRGLKLVCVQYPMRSAEPLKRILDYDERVIFVDNKLKFRAAIKKDGYKDYFEDMFAGDFGHCTPKGNALLAGNIARTIVQALFHK